MLIIQTQPYRDGDFGGREVLVRRGGRRGI
jgi:hypothetical protein